MNATFATFATFLPIPDALADLAGRDPITAFNAWRRLGHQLPDGRRVRPSLSFYKTFKLAVSTGLHSFPIHMEEGDFTLLPVREE